MRPLNFPARIERRRLRAAMPKNQKTEPDPGSLVAARSLTTKKKRSAKK